MIKHILHKILEWLYPTRAVCQGCKDECGCDEDFLCAKCQALLIPSNVITVRTEWKSQGLDEAAFVYYYGRPVTGLVHALKFRGIGILAPHMAEEMVCLLREKFHRSYDCIIPIPLHPSRLRERGFNQSELLAQKIAQSCDIELRTDIVYRSRKTRQQAKLSKDKRKENLTGAFTVQQKVVGKHILLVDDVITTGSTVCACAYALKQAGAKEVRAIAFSGTRHCHHGTKHSYHQNKA